MSKLASNITNQNTKREYWLQHIKQWQWLLDVCWRESVASYTLMLYQHHLTKLHSEVVVLSVAA